MDNQGGITSWFKNFIEPQKKSETKQKVSESTEKVNELAKGIKRAAPEAANSPKPILKPKETKESLFDTVLKINIANDKNEIQDKLNKIEIAYKEGNVDEADKLLNEYSTDLQKEFPKIVAYQGNYSISYENQDLIDIIADVMDSEIDPKELKDSLQLLRTFSEAVIDTFYQSVSKEIPVDILEKLPKKKLDELRELLDTIPDYVPTSKLGIKGFHKEVNVRRYNVKSKPVETKDLKKETQKLDQAYTEYTGSKRKERARLTPTVFAKERIEAYLKNHTLKTDADYKAMHNELYKQIRSYLKEHKENLDELLPIYRKELIDQELKLQEKQKKLQE